jgi:hypothetical protein
MRRTDARATFVFSLCCFLSLLQQIPAKAEIIYGITQQGNAIFSFDSATPGTLLSFQPVTGFLSGPFGIDSIGSIDIRPSNGKLYGVSANGRIYTVDPLTGIATVASTIRSAQPLPPSLFPNVGGFDFDPVSDSLRVVSPSTSNGPNLRVNVDTGDAVIEGPVHFDPGDIERNAFTVGIAYANTSNGATSTTLYAVTPSEAPNRPTSWVLSTMDPSTGTLHSIGLLDTFCGGSGAGFDISGLTGSAYFASGDLLFSVNLQTGLATEIGSIGGAGFSNQFISRIAAPVAAVQPVPEPTSLTVFTAGLIGLGLLAIRRAPREKFLKITDLG